MEMPAALSRQLGPFPVYGWIGIVGAGIGLGVVIRRRFPGQQEEPPVAPVDDETTATVAPAAGTGVSTGAFYGNGSTVGQPQGAGASPVGTPAPAITNNIEWTSAVTRFLLAKGIDPVVSVNAPVKYLAGIKLGPREGQAMAMAFAVYGQPPEGGPPVKAPPLAVPPIARPRSIPAPVGTPAPKPLPGALYNSTPTPAVIRQ